MICCSFFQAFGGQISWCLKFRVTNYIHLISNPPPTPLAKRSRVLFGGRGAGLAGGGCKNSFHHDTVCPRSLDPFYIYSKLLYKFGQDFLARQYQYMVLYQMVHQIPLRARGMRKFDLFTAFVNITNKNIKCYFWKWLSTRAQGYIN